MSLQFSTLGGLYSAYANATLPWNDLHGLSAKLATAPARRGPVAAGALNGRDGANLPPAPAGRARTFAYRAAVLPNAIMRLPDALFGTGIHRQGSPVHITNGNEAVAHLRECLHSPLDTGLIGLGQGVSLLAAAAEGAFYGAVIGAVFGARSSRIETCAATGAVISAALWWLPLALVLSATNGVFRAATSLAKFAVVGAFYGLGFAVGSLADRWSAAPALTPALP